MKLFIIALLTFTSFSCLKELDFTTEELSPFDIRYENDNWCSLVDVSIDYSTINITHYVYVTFKFKVNDPKLIESDVPYSPPRFMDGNDMVFTYRRSMHKSKLGKEYCLYPAYAIGFGSFWLNSIKICTVL